MASTSYSTPLVGLDAVVLDTETTGLDARTARIVQIGAIKIHGPKIDETARFESLVNPGIPIPPKTTAVHGISDAMVANAPPFARLMAEFEAFRGTSIIIGHTTSYDLGMLKRETELAGGVWRQPRALDVRILARIAAPTLAHHNLDMLCNWLEIELTGRHTAMGDAIATARIFGALLPLLRQRNIRTLAEAEAATRHLAELDARSAGGLMADVGGPATDATRSLGRIDSFAYRHRVRDVMTQPPIMASVDADLRAGISALVDNKTSSLYVTDPAGEIGIVTERDVLRALKAYGGVALDMPLHDFANKPLQSVSDEAFVYRAIGRMTRLGYRHLGVRNAKGEVVGALSTRSLLRHRAETAIALGDEIDSAPDAAALGSAWAKLPLMARSLISDAVDPRTIASVVSSEVCVLTRRAAQMAEASMDATGLGGPPCRYAVLVLGSAGRGESLLATDQDNAIVYERGDKGGDADMWFEELGARISDILDEVGVPYCKGGVMAKNALWRQSVKDWRATIQGWVRRQKPADLLNVDIFYDATPVYGDAALGESIWTYAYDVASRSPDFIALLSELARGWNPPFTLFGGIRVDQSGRIDLKKNGLMPIFTGARVLSIRHNTHARSTPDRLNAVLAKGIGAPQDIEAILEAHKTLIGVMLDQQLVDIEQGIPLSPKVDVERLGKSGKSDLKDALSTVPTIIDLVGEGRI